MKYKLSLVAAILLAFGIGLFFGVKYHRVIFIKQNHKLYFCPSAKLALNNFRKVGKWPAQNLLWSKECCSWIPEKKIEFSQAMLDKDDNLYCYYQWPSSKQPGTRLWSVFKLNRSEHMAIRMAGPYWGTGDNDAEKLCNASIDACGFQVSKAMKVKDVTSNVRELTIQDVISISLSLLGY